MVSTVSAESGRPDRVAGLPDNRALDTGIAALTVALLLVSLGGVFRMHISQAVTLVLLIITFGGIYSFGALQMRRWNAIARVLWMLALTAVWVAAMFLTPVAVYWVFILFFLFMRAFNGWYGVVGVVGVLAISILVQIPDGLTLGGVMGPTVSALVVIMITYAFKVIARVSAEREALIQELVDTQEALALKEREAGVVQERQRLAHEIHDTVAQSLSSIQMLLHAAERDLMSSGLEREALASPLRRIEVARHSASDNLAETRAMIAALTPAPLSETSLPEALERIAGSFAQAGEMDITVDVDGQPRQLPMRVEAGLLRIAQGAVGNVVKHSGASMARVTLTFAPDEVRLDVVDNGQGFDVDALPERPSGLGHLGLDAMRTRARELGGELIIESAPSGSTALSIVVPDGDTINRKIEEEE
ncbi:sensor histidine kinase [Corynebacterium genitalium ATCC 33030]|uniref:ATPase/histidine kinase/DNA gyrase B/HSP90 domain protein n=1 Tax=Corynebacterium genitalium ATCC 33030 TaxID=585529 RepID=D7W9D1_9CORY|nr:sensor histidine kinase [Corynebacterium genitalium]EFK55411.1 ATPase/histidine kinase/DNA gyrase B/HSP90 domain protein [Corynebacterium genitalium ATCC 33030]UUA89343.1 sensor histidine kinase [Corynebacterium genitalium ATCC 33030]